MSDLPNDAVALDIGAHIGTATRLLASRFPKGKVYAFEPSPETFQQLERNCAIRQNVECFQLALGRNNGVEQYSSDSTLSVLRRIVPEGKDSIEVQAMRLADWVDQYRVNRLDLIKIDVEGFEEDVLVPAAEVLERLRPQIVFEYCPPFPQERSHFKGERLFPLLASLGYTVYLLDESGRRHTDLDATGEHLTCDYVAVPPGLARF